MTPEQLAAVMLAHLKTQGAYVQDEGDDYGPTYVLVDGGVNLLKLATAVLSAIENDRVEKAIRFGEWLRANSDRRADGFESPPSQG